LFIINVEREKEILMNKIEYFDRTKVKLIRNRINETLESLGEELGITFEAGNASFSEKNGNFKLNMVIGSGEEASENSAEAEDFRRHAVLWGLSPDDLGKTVTNFDGDQFVIVGAKPRSKKYPILAQKISDGKTYKLPVNMVLASKNSACGI
jgi:hypothetical protein